MLDLIYLWKLKKIEDQINQYDGALMMLEEQKMLLENDSTLGIANIIHANHVIRSSNSSFTVEHLDRIKDDMSDLKSEQEEIRNFFQEYSCNDNEEMQDEFNDYLKSENVELGCQSFGNINKLEKTKVNKKEQDEKALDDFLNDHVDIKLSSPLIKKEEKEKSDNIKINKKEEEEKKILSDIVDLKQKSPIINKEVKEKIWY